MRTVGARREVSEAWCCSRARHRLAVGSCKAPHNTNEPLCRCDSALRGARAARARRWNALYAAPSSVELEVLPVLCGLWISGWQRRAVVLQAFHKLDTALRSGVACAQVERAVCGAQRRGAGDAAAAGRLLHVQAGGGRALGGL